MKKITSEIARIHAHICGDGCVYIKMLKRSPKELASHRRKNIFEKIWVMEYTNTSEILRNEFIEDIKKAFNRKCYDYSKYKRVVLTHCKWIIKKLDLEGKNSYNWDVYRKTTSNKPVLAAWLRAFFDDEATVNTKQRMIRIKSMNKKGLQQVSFMLNKLGIYSKITGQNSDHSWYLNLYKNDLKIYGDKIGFLHPSKKEKLFLILKEWARRDLNS